MRACCSSYPPITTCPNNRPSPRRSASSRAPWHRAQALGVMGMAPPGPEISYGYIEQGAAVGEPFRVARFHRKSPIGRKPRTCWSKATSTGTRGCSSTPLRVLREELATHAPGLWEASGSLAGSRAIGALSGRRKNLSWIAPSWKKSSRVVMVPGRFPWSDVGIFFGPRRLPKDACGNSGWGPGRVEDCWGCLIVTRTPRALVRRAEGHGCHRDGGRPPRH